MGGFGILFMLLILITVALPIFILFICSKVLGKGNNILKRKIKPNEEYLEEIEKIQDTKISRLIDKSITTILPFYIFFNDNENLGRYITVVWHFLLICFLIKELFNYKKAFSYITTKSENTSTKKYLASILMVIAILWLVSLTGAYLIDKNFIIN